MKFVEFIESQQTLFARVSLRLDFIRNTDHWKVIGMRFQIIEYRLNSITFTDSYLKISKFIENHEKTLDINSINGIQLES